MGFVLVRCAWWRWNYLEQQRIRLQKSLVDQLVVMVDRREAQKH